MALDLTGNEMSTQTHHASTTQSTQTEPPPPTNNQLTNFPDHSVTHEEYQIARVNFYVSRTLYVYNSHNNAEMIHNGSLTIEILQELTGYYGPLPENKKIYRKTLLGILRYIHPDRSNHPQSTLATTILNLCIYNSLLSD